MIAPYGLGTRAIDYEMQLRKRQMQAQMMQKESFSQHLIEEKNTKPKTNKKLLLL